MYPPQGQEPGQGRDRNCEEREWEKDRERERFQDISSLHWRAMREMRGGWVGCGAGVGGSQVDPARCLTSSQPLQRPQVTLFPVQSKSRERRKPRDYPLLSPRSCYNSIMAVTQRWGQLMSNIGETPPFTLITPWLLKRLLNRNLPEIIIIPSEIEHKRERLTIYFCLR